MQVDKTTHTCIIFMHTMTNVSFIAAATSRILGLLLVTRHGRTLTYALGDLVEAARSTLLIASRQTQSLYFH